ILRRLFWSRIRCSSSGIGCSGDYDNGRSWCGRGCGSAKTDGPSDRASSSTKLNPGSERGSGDSDDDLTFLEVMFRDIGILFNNDFNERLGLSICDRRSVDSGEGEEEGSESRCDK